MPRCNISCIVLAALCVSAAPAGAGPQQNSPVIVQQRAADLAAAANALSKAGAPAADLRRALVLYENAANLGDVWSHVMAAYLYRRQFTTDGFNNSLRLIKRAMALCDHGSRDQQCGQPVLWQQLSNSQSGLSQFGDALISMRKALTLAEAQPATDPTFLAELHGGIGDLLQSIGQTQQAVLELERARDVLQANMPANDIRLGGMIFSLAVAYEHAGRFAESVAGYRQALAIYEAQPAPDIGRLGETHSNLGWALTELRKYDEGYAEFQIASRQMAQAFGNQSSELAYPIANMAILRERQGRHDEAISLNMKALVIETHFHDAMLDPLRWTLQSLSHSWKAKGRLDRAILFAKLAVNAHQEIRQKSSGLDAQQSAALANDWRGIYDDLAAMLVTQGRIAEAQHVLDLQKNQELIEFVRGDESPEAKTGGTSFLPREAAAEKDIGAAMQRPIRIAAEIDALATKQLAGALTADESKRLAELNKQLDESYSAFTENVDALLSRDEADAAMGDIESLDLKFAGDRQEMLRQFETPTVLLQAASLGDSLHLFLTTKDISVHREVKIARADLAAKVMDALQAISEHDAEADEKLSGLYDLLVKPIESDLKDSKADVVMLNLGGFLRYVPFAALKSGHGYLIEDYALVLDTPAAKTRYQATDRSRPSAAGFGLTEPKDGFPALPGVGAELSAIFASGNSGGTLPGSPRLNADFTAESLRGALQLRPALLHVASHFKFVPGDETKSFLLLGDGSELNLSTLRKARGFRFGGVDLLTLSACETARGSDAEGDEVESFGAIAQMNGASAVMATLWPIADAASARLMSDFYSGLVRGKLDKAEALRRAQIAMLRGVDAASVDLHTRGAADADAPDAAPAPPTGTRHPYYWSPYILMGNWL